jgi:hypothetical protein
MERREAHPTQSTPAQADVATGLHVEARRAQ